MGGFGKNEHPVCRTTGRSCVHFPEVPPTHPHTHIFTPVPILYLPEPAGEAAAKDTGVSATSPGSIVHQAASVMGSSL